MCSGEKVLVFNSRIKLFLGKLKSKWSVPIEALRMTPHGVVELKGETGPTFLVNGQRVKHYSGADSNPDREARELDGE